MALFFIHFNLATLSRETHTRRRGRGRERDVAPSQYEQAKILESCSARRIIYLSMKPETKTIRRGNGKSLF